MLLNYTLKMFHFMFCESHLNNKDKAYTQQPKLFKGAELQLDIVTYAGYSLSELLELFSEVVSVCFLEFFKH